MTFTQCAVFLFMKQHTNEEEKEFFNRSLCQFDFSLPNYLGKGGFYESKHILSAGGDRCDMKSCAAPIKKHLNK